MLELTNQLSQPRNQLIFSIKNQLRLPLTFYVGYFKLAKHTCIHSYAVIWKASEHVILKSVRISAQGCGRHNKRHIKHRCNSQKTWRLKILSKICRALRNKVLEITTLNLFLNKFSQWTLYLLNTFRTGIYFWRSLISIKKLIENYQIERHNYFHLAPPDVN